MNTQKHKYFEFNESTNAPYSALVNAESSNQAIEIYKEYVTNDDVENVSCNELSSSKAWLKMVKSRSIYHDSKIEDDIISFDQKGLLMIDSDLA